MININSIYSDLRDIAQKGFDGYLTPSEFNRIAELANAQYFRSLYGTTGSYRYDKPASRIAYPATKQISEKLNKFIETEEFPGPVSSVVMDDTVIRTITVDNKYVSISGSDKTVSARRVEIDRFNSYRNSAIDTPTKEFPIYSQEGSSLMLLPEFDHVILKYLRMPETPVWGYTVVGNRPVYNAATSTDFEWDSDDRVPLLFLMASTLGIELKDIDVVNYSEAKKND